MEVINPTPNSPQTESESSFQSTPAYQPSLVPQAPIVSVGDWFVTMLLINIPVVNLVLLLVWAFSSSTNPSKAAFAKANLIWLAIVVILSIFFFSSLMALFMALR